MFLFIIDTILFFVALEKKYELFINLIYKIKKGKWIMDKIFNVKFNRDTVFIM